MMNVSKGWFVLFWLVVSCGFTAADTLLVWQESYGDEPPREIRYWIGEGKSARIDGDRSMIVRLDEGRTYFVNHASRTYQVLERETESRAPSTSQVTVTQTGETRRIGSWNARGSVIQVRTGDFEMDVKVWTSSEVVFDRTSYDRLVRETAASAGMDWMIAILELDGFPVLQEASAGPIQSRQQLVSIESRPAPAGTYSPPAGYVEQ